MADEDSGTNNQQTQTPDPQAPGSRRIVPSFVKALAKNAVAGVALADKAGPTSGDSVLEAILAATQRRRPAPTSRSSSSKGSTSTTTNSEPNGFGKTINLKYRKVYGATINTGDDRIDSEVSRVVSQVAGAVNDFQENVTKTFRIVGRRLIALEKGTPQLVQRIDRVQANQKTLADQVGYILQAMDDDKKAVKKAQPSNIDKQLQALRDRASKMERDEKGRFVRKKTSSSDILSTVKNAAEDIGGAWAGTKALRFMGGVGTGLGTVAKSVLGGVGGLAVYGGLKYRYESQKEELKNKLGREPTDEEVQIYILNKENGTGQQERNKLGYIDNIKKNWLGMKVDEKNGKKPIQTEKSSGSFWSNLFGDSSKKEGKKPEEAQEYKLTPYNMTFDVGNDIYFKAFKDLRLKGERITIEADELKFNVNRVTGLTAGAVGNADGKGGVRNFRKGVTTPQGSREEPSQGFFGTKPGQIGAESIGPGGAPALSMDGIRQLRTGVSGGYSGAESVGIPGAGGRVPNEQLLEKYKEGTTRLIHRGGNLHGTDPKLLNVLKEASKDLPSGYRAEIISAHDGRASGTTNHPAGIAVDLQIYDDKGRRVPNLKGSWGYGIYEKMYQSAYTRGQDLYPKEKLLWGGGFASGVANDKMHYQWQKPIPGSSQGMAAYDPKTGINPQYKQSFDPSGEAMTPKQIQEYQKSIKEKIEQEKTGAPATEAKENGPAPAAGSDEVNPLAAQRASFMEQIKKDPRLQQTAMAMMLAEEGGDSKARKALLETVMNRSSAHGYTDLLNQGFDRKYYAPFQDGSFNRNLQKVLADPKLRERLMSEIEEVGRGSNVSNFATQNGSAGVGRRARQTQSVGLVADNRETFSRKDREEFAGIHGAGYTQAEKDWYKRTSAAVAQEERGPQLLPAPSREAADYHMVKPAPIKTQLTDDEALKIAAMSGDMGMPASVLPTKQDWPAYGGLTQAEADKAFGPPPAPVATKQPESKEAQSKQTYYDTRISHPRHDAEAAPPTPGSDGYGSGACDPDGGGICAV